MSDMREEEFQGSSKEKYSVTDAKENALYVLF